MFTKRSKWLVPVIVAAILAAIFAASYFYFFGEVRDAAALVPSDAMIFVSLENGGNNFLNNESNSFLKKLEDAFWQSFVGSDNSGYVNFEKDIKPWLGREVALVKKSSDMLDPFIVLFHVGSKRKALDAMEDLRGKFVGEDSKPIEERYKGVDLFTIGGEITPLTICYIKGYLVASQSKESVKEIIDVKNGDRSSLARHKEYRTVKNSLRKKDDDVFAVLRIREIMESTTSTLDVASQLFVKRLNLPEDMRLGLSFAEIDGGFRMKTFLNIARFDSVEGTNFEMAEFAPVNSIVYFESTNLANIIQESVPEDVDFNRDIVSWADGPYAVAFLSQEDGKKSAFGLIMKVDDEDVVNVKMKLVEPLIVNAFSKIGVTGGIEFLDGDYKGVNIRYISFESGLGMDLNYAVVSGKLLAATSKEAMYEMIDVARGDVTNINDNEEFKSTLRLMDVKNANSMLFINPQNFLKFVKQGEFSEGIEGRKGILDMMLEPFNGIGLVTSNVGKAGLMTDTVILKKR